MSRLLPIYLAALRKQHNLTQDELAALLSLTPSGLSKFESRVRRPTLELVLGSEVVFGNSAKYVFPAFYGEIEDRVMAQAKLLYATLEARSDIPAQEKRQLLEEMIKRAEAHDFRL